MPIVVASQKYTIFHRLDWLQQTYQRHYLVAKKKIMEWNRSLLNQQAILYPSNMLTRKKTLLLLQNSFDDLFILGRISGDYD